MPYRYGFKPLIKRALKLKRAQLLGIALHKKNIDFADHLVVINNLRPKHSPDDTKKQRAAVLEEELRRHLRLTSDKERNYFAVSHIINFVVMVYLGVA